MVCTVATDTRCVASLSPRWFVWKAGGRFLLVHRLGKDSQLSRIYAAQSLTRCWRQRTTPDCRSRTKHGLLYKADLLSEKVPNARDLVSILQESPISDELYRKIGREIRKMHDAQVNHTDLNIHNILIDDQEKVWIIDFDKCYVQIGDSWKQGNLKRLKRSFEKEVCKRGINWSLEAFAIISSYKHEE